MMRSSSRILLATTAILATLLMGAGTSFAATDWTYTDPVCGCDGDGCDTWSWSIKCTVTAGVAGQPHHFETAVEILPNGTDPIATITDLLGNPVIIDTVELTLVPSAAVGDKALATNGLSDPAHAWFGFQTNIDIPSTDGDSEDDFIVTYTFPDPVDPAGAAWFSDDSDDRYGNTVTDAYILFDNPVPAAQVNWGQIKASFR